MTINWQLVCVSCIYIMLQLHSQNFGHHLVKAFSVLILNINVSNGLNLISALRSAKKPKSKLFCSFATVLSISKHLYCSHNGEVFLWTLYALTWIPERRQTWYQRKEWNANVSKTWSDWNLCTLGVQGLLHPVVPCTRRNDKVIRRSEKHYLVFIYSVRLHPYGIKSWCSHTLASFRLQTAVLIPSSGCGTN